MGANLDKAKSMPAVWDSFPGGRARLILRTGFVNLAGRFPRRVEDGSDLLEQFFAGVWLGNESAQTLREHVARVCFARQTTAQNHCDIWIQRAEFVENGVAVHDWKEKVEDDQTDLFD